MDQYLTPFLNDLEKIPPRLIDVDALVVGFCYKLSYAHLCVAVYCLTREGGENVEFVASNSDTTYPTSSGILQPGTGAIIKSIEVGAGRNVDVVCGKPNEILAKMLQIEDPRSAVMVGDRVETDMLFGKNAGMYTVLVTSGVSNPGDGDGNENVDEEVDCLGTFVTRILSQESE